MKWHGMARRGKARRGKDWLEKRDNEATRPARREGIMVPELPVGRFSDDTAHRRLAKGEGARHNWLSS